MKDNEGGEVDAQARALVEGKSVHKRPWLWIAVTSMLPLGCSSSLPASGPSVDTGTQQSALNTFLLFDRVSGNTFATAIVPRQSWPYVSTGIQLHEHIRFQEFFEDRQGHNRRDDNDFHRRFTTHRVGIIER